MIHSIRWQLDSVCCHLTCQHCGEKNMLLVQLAVKDKYRQTQTNMLVCVWINSGKCRRDIILLTCSRKKTKLGFCWRCFFPCGAQAQASQASLFAFIFTRFNTSVPCHIPEHIQISPWHFTHCCVLCFIMPSEWCTQSVSKQDGVPEYRKISLPKTYLIPNWT